MRTKKPNHVLETLKKSQFKRWQNRKFTKRNSKAFEKCR